MKTLIVAGTDTNVGKTVVAAMLTLELDGVYWKPVQAGTLGGTDRARVAALTGLGEAHFRPERYLLREALSPHRAAELEGMEIEEARLALPRDVADSDWLIVEGAGGVLVPLNRHTLQADLFARWGAPALLAARTSLGTINHTLLSLEALRSRGIGVLGIVFVGDAMTDTERAVAEFGDARVLGCLPALPALDAQALRDAFAKHFRKGDFEAAYG